MMEFKSTLICITFEYKFFKDSSYWHRLRYFCVFAVGRTWVHSENTICVTWWSYASLCGCCDLNVHIIVEKIEYYPLSHPDSQVPLDPLVVKENGNHYGWKFLSKPVSFNKILRLSLHGFVGVKFGKILCHFGES